MSQRSIFAKGLLAAAAATTIFAGAAAPQAASAQSTYYDQHYGDRSYDDRSAYEDCRQDRSDHQVAGAVIGGLAGAAIGGGVSGRGSGALIGGALGAAGGLAVGTATSCQPGQTGYDQAPPPPGYDDRYGYGDDYAAPQPSCTWAEDRITFPDGTFQRSSVRVCHEPGGRWYVAQ